MNTTTNPQNKAREFNLERTHAVGQYLRSDTAAARVMAGYRREQQGAFSLQSRAKFKG